MSLIEIEKEARESMGLSQRKLSKQSGVSQSKISDFENGKDRLSDDEKKSDL